jgi:hypothetical protein
MKRPSPRLVDRRSPRPEAGEGTWTRGLKITCRASTVYRGAIVLHPHADRVGLAARLENYRQAPRAVLNRVVQKIREDLLQAGAVESAAQVARHLEAKT